MLNPLEWVRDGSGPGSGFDWPRVLLVALVATVLASLLVVAATSTAAFGPYNPSWDGTSELRQQIESEPGVESELIRDTARYEAHEPNETVAFVVAPDEQYTDEDAARVQQFVNAGGTLVVFENFGANGNDLLEAAGAEARADGVLLRDEQEFFRGPTMPVATGVENHTFTEDVDQLTLNYASAVEPGEATVLVRTSDYAYRDIDGDGQLSAGEEPAAYPVATVESVSAGQVVVVGDPSIAVNAMIDEPDNTAFLRGLYTDADHVLIDLSHGEELPPLTGVTLTLRETPLLQILVGAVGIGAIAAASRRRRWPTLERARAAIGDRVGDRPAVDEAAVAPVLELDDERRAAVLRRRHPDWDEQRIQRVIAALNRHGTKQDDE
ncbi:DUF4350 domain-containing protein [Natronorubrum sp. JWXQ-INN-674]|uniref:DUF4350 domain-containing protein n=1 Tax=Natronorubrum halalkaliphilum TaxID=2691917 RepID=A0A6B0VST6_9EURY|nr:DUF4350 domain-containing protein [Natronorubrum halalkaliphilum]MXV64203.1 DUF4350 domain-containing protein [Natronorubrum halalkaliphilum]